MRRAVVILAAVAAAVTAGTAGAGTFSVASAPETLPSADVPNAPGSIRVPVPLDALPAQPAALSYDELLDLWRRAGAAYGVPWEVLAAINKIESDFGRNMGPSSAGALGWMQFIPSSWMRWGLDADGDGIADPWNPEDAVYAAARYLAAAGAREDLARAVFAYNHADWYVDDVLELADLFGGGEAGFGAFDFGPSGPEAVFHVDDVQQRLADARRRVVRARRSIPVAERRIEELEQSVLVLEQRAGDPSLSTRAFLRLDRKIARLEHARAQTERRLERRRTELDYAVSALDQLREEAASATLAAPAAESLDVAASSGGYVFPVGGGPDIVSVGHTHHDYSAADITAPEGSPLYALADSTVVETYLDPEGRCGIGLKLRLSSGPVYVYCHLAYLEPDVVPGTALAAGASVGLLGSTGNSTGPHLHLQLAPAVAYPQEEPWFRSFAGRAFTWTDAPTPKPRAVQQQRGPVFRVVTRAKREPARNSAVRVMGFTR
jgi:murein DD-endopeptidase MepM/ murein hydrolase activator NlpD